MSSPTVVQLVELLCLILFFSVTDKASYVEEENVPPIRTEDVSKQLIGRMKGIQGHCNSCYMDSALFRLELIDPRLKMKRVINFADYMQMQCLYRKPLKIV